MAQRQETFTDCDRCLAKAVSAHVTLWVTVGTRFDGVETEQLRERCDLCVRCAEVMLGLWVQKMGHAEAAAWLLGIRSAKARTGK